MSAPNIATPQHRPAQTPTPMKNGTSTPLQLPPTTATPNAPPKAWSEEDYIASLAQLEQLQDVVSSLRTTIPQLVRSLTRKHDVPTDLYKSFSREAISGNRKLAELKKRWESGDMRDIRVKVDTSIKEHGRSIDGLPQECVEGVKEAVTAMPRYGWMEESEELQGLKRKRDLEDGGGDASAKDEEKVVEEFRKRHEDVTVGHDKDTRKVTLDIKTTDDEELHFEVTPQTEDDKTTYSVTGPRISDPAARWTRKLYQSINRCLAKRRKPGNLEHTLETLAAYRNLSESKCEACQRAVDAEMMVCAVRRSKRVKVDGGGEKVEWVAAHESCVVAGT